MSDSNADKVWVKKKFRGDLASALEQNPDLKGFLFFTNVDLTPTESDGLVAHARKRGISHVEVLYRERLRLLLDSPRGLKTRLDYLDIEMSKAEQVTFFPEFGSHIEQLMSLGFGAIAEKTERLEFLSALDTQAETATFVAKLKRGYSVEELGHFRAMLTIMKLAPDGEALKLHFAARDAYYEWHAGDATVPLYGVRTMVWVDPDKKLEDTVIGGEETTGQIESFGAINGRDPFATLRDFDCSMLLIHVTEPLHEKISALGLVVNGYLLAYAEAETLINRPRDPMETWPLELSVEEQQIGWLELLLRPGYQDEHGFPPHAPWLVDYSRRTPRNLVGNVPL